MKDKLIKRLREYYKLEKFHTIWISLFCIFLNIKFGWIQSLLLSYGMFLVVFILAQGTYYWKLKLYELQDKDVDNQKVLKRFRRFELINSCLIFIFPSILVTQTLYFNKIFVLQLNKGWALFAYVFGIAEHVNYYYVQLMYDNKNDWKYLQIYKRLKIASLRKDLKENKM